MERGAGIENVQKMLIRPVEDRTNYVPILRLSLVKFVAATGLVTLWALGFRDLILASDHTRISLVIFAIWVGTTLHYFYQTIAVSRDITAR